MSKPPAEEKDKSIPHFHHTHLYPDAVGLLGTQFATLSDSKDSAVFVLDTNILIMPYSTKPKALSVILETYGRLIAKHRLFVPAQAIREFARIRPEKVKDLFQRLSKHRNSLKPPSLDQSTVLESVPELSEVVKLEEEIRSKIDQYHKAVGRVLDVIRNWNWNDPVSVGYRELFTKDVVVEVQKKEEEIAKDLHRRFASKIPPGYKDASKPDGGIGDLIIWQTILELGSKLKNDLIFVTGEEKSDWWHKSDNENLYPRFELSDEFRRVSGKKFGIAKFSDVLQAFGADTDVIEEIRIEEDAKSRVVAAFDRALLGLNRYHQLLNAVINWAAEKWPDLAVAVRDSALDLLEPEKGTLLFRVIPMTNEALQDYRTNPPHWANSSEKKVVLVYRPELKGSEMQEVDATIRDVLSLSGSITDCGVFQLDANGRVHLLGRYRGGWSIL